ncbi:MAG: chemotaxis protein CheB [Acetivibrionales bacterium]
MRKGLNALSHIIVKEGEDGEVIKPGYAYIAPGDFHMEVNCKPGGDIKNKTDKRRSRSKVTGLLSM